MRLLRRDNAEKKYLTPESPIEFYSKLRFRDVNFYRPPIPEDTCWALISPILLF